MRSPVHALLWEQWRRVRWPMLFAYVLMAAASLLDYIGTETVLYPPVGGELSAAMMILCMGVFLAFLFFSHSEATDLRLRLPPRLYTLPVKTHALVNCEFFLRLAAVGLLAFAMQGTHYLLWRHSPFYDFDLLWKVPFLLIGSVAFLQAVSWWPRGPWVVGAVVLGVALVSQVRRTAPQPIQEVVELGEGAKLALMVALTGASYLIALAGVRLDRRAAWMNIRRRLAAMLRQRAARRDRFSSPARAQLWFEWKRKGKYVPIAAIACLALWFLVYRYLLFGDLFAARIVVSETARAVLAGTAREEMAAILVGGALFACPVLAAFIVGMLIPAQDHHDRVSGFSCFIMTRPIRTGELAAARLKMGALSLGLTYVLISLPLILFLGLPAFVNALALLSPETSPLLLVGVELAAFILLVCGPLALAWTLLWLSLPLSGLLLVYWPIASGLYFVAPFREENLLSWTISAILLFGTAALVVLAARRRLLTRQALPTVALGLVGAVALLMWMYAAGWPTQPGHADTAIRLAISLLPAVTFIWEPLKLDWFRHR